MSTCALGFCGDEIRATAILLGVYLMRGHGVAEVMGDEELVVIEDDLPYEGIHDQFSDLRLLLAESACSRFLCKHFFYQSIWLIQT